jgi:hypothetical protein
MENIIWELQMSQKLAFRAKSGHRKRLTATTLRRLSSLNYKTPKTIVAMLAVKCQFLGVTLRTKIFAGKVVTFHCAQIRRKKLLLST